MDKFFIKNDIGVDIECTIVGTYKKDKEYFIYTDFTSDNSKIGIKLYVAIKQDEQYVSVSDDEATIILNEFNENILKYKRG